MGLINKSKIREKVELAVADEVEVELEKIIEEIMKKAESRAKANMRRTIFARDL